ncbi:DUF2845 domain-containing protein [Spartinivicinus poritis]|uniref:DUF2845 domain-containing protein n=1 Tax=Spartinivicinus poritis TaxID=2994640 RepID=A0ABT5UCG2_9GAMM|nr:DUF2845 domain-containing protein [Spartinivicinus sp. A2-2]MDE1463681.1 DUF2845 domain-containing protein [Spartinivicinus sp. A2-2]
MIASRLFVLVAMTLITANSYAMRCDGKPISSGYTKAKVILFCGQPILKETFRQEITERNSHVSFSDSQKKTSSQTTKETIKDITKDRWTYKQGKFLRVVIFHKGRVESIEFGGRIE